ncbi:hypothetical protein E3U36_04400 [Arsenophonus endosymbiont of Aphis craccivora]|uniref:hypothetical protein n=1 Tax=Arsenophonus endosymbiont of Aphis craccivora TaxID=1231049 RepID=UPI0015DC669C|nr:hypothetical protein [Arsenophonus endosymbiont of Aphis craccivora]QLK87577.1 hypothetical protein E3U36_04400 [Arsenophonus endosymbiont of Aphis craccivora]
MSGNILVCQTSFEKFNNNHNQCKNITSTTLESEISTDRALPINTQTNLVFIQIKYCNQYYHAKYDEQGNWQLNLPITNEINPYNSIEITIYGEGDDPLWQQKLTVAELIDKQNLVKKHQTTSSATPSEEPPISLNNLTNQKWHFGQQKIIFAYQMLNFTDQVASQAKVFSIRMQDSAGHLVLDIAYMLLENITSGTTLAAAMEEHINRNLPEHKGVQVIYYDRQLIITDPHKRTVETLVLG